MEILVLSDSHGARHRIARVMEQINFRPEAILFLGDGFRDLTVLTESERYRNIPLLSVRGNCDGSMFLPENEFPAERSLWLGGHKIFMAHGDRFGVRGGIVTLASAAASQDAEIALFGHTHVPHEETVPVGTKFGNVTVKKPLLIANPGSLGEPRDGAEPTFGVLTIRGDTVLFSHGAVKDF